MRRIFNVYAANHASPHGASVQLDLPASAYTMQDAMAKLRLSKPDDLYFQIESYGDHTYLYRFLEENTTLGDLNLLAHRMAQFSETEDIAFEGMVSWEDEHGAEKIPISRLINLAYSTEDCHVLGEALNDEHLGRFYADNDFVTILDKLPDELYDKLDFAKIGKEMREKEHGTFTPRGYVVNTAPIQEVYEKVSAEAEYPDYILCLTLASEANPQGFKLKLPAEQTQLNAALQALELEDWNGMQLHDFDGVIPKLGIDLYHDSIEEINALSKRLRQIDADCKLIKFKAVLAAIECTDVDMAIKVADHFDDYIFEPEMDSPEAVGRREIEMFVPEESAETLLKHIDLYDYGRDIIKEYGSTLTAYGLVTKRDEQDLAESIHSEPEPESEIDIMWDDLRLETQQRIERMLGENGNYDVFPIATISAGEPEQSMQM